MVILSFIYFNKMVNFYSFTHASKYNMYHQEYNMTSKPPQAEALMPSSSSSSSSIDIKAGHITSSLECTGSHARDKLLPTPGTQTCGIIHSQRNYMRPLSELRPIHTTRFHRLLGNAVPDARARLGPQQEHGDWCGHPPLHVAIPCTSLGTLTFYYQRECALIIHYNTQTQS